MTRKIIYLHAQDHSHHLSLTVEAVKDALMPGVEGSRHRPAEELGRDCSLFGGCDT